MVTRTARQYFNSSWVDTNVERFDRGSAGSEGGGGRGGCGTESQTLSSITTQKTGCGGKDTFSDGSLDAVRCVSATYLIQPETTLWEVMFWWLPDLDDEDDDEEEDDNDDQRVKTRTGGTARPPRGLRNKPLTDRKLTKRSEGKLKVRRAKRRSDGRLKEQMEREDLEDPDGPEEDEQEETEEPGQNKPLREPNVKKKTPKSRNQV